MDAPDFQALIATVRERVDLADLVGRDIELRRCGSVFKGRSPVNHDQTPSFVIWPRSGRWRDYSGGGEVGGDCFDYVCRRDGVSFIEALTFLAAHVGVDGPSARDTDPRWAERRRLEEILTLAARHYHAALPADIRGSWLYDRYGLTDDTIDEFGLGWADGQVHRHLLTQGVTRDEVLASGLVLELNGQLVDFFRGRIVFPYWRGGRVAYMSARQTERTPDTAAERDAKYKKLLVAGPERPHLSPHLRNDVFFNEDAARGKVDELLITEGITDCLAAHQAEVRAISLATTRLREADHARLLQLTERAAKVVICFDNEKNGSGQKGAIQVARVLFDAGRNVRIASLARPDDVEKVDLNDVLRTQGRAALKFAVRCAGSFPAALIGFLPADLPSADQAAALEPIVALLQTVDPVERQKCQEAIREKFDLRAATVAELFKEAPQDADQGTTRPAPPAQYRGEVYEGRDHYFTLVPRDGTVIISSFRLEPTRRIRLDEGEMIEADVVTDRGATHRGMRFPRDTWNSTAAFQRSLKSVDLQWTGSDANVQGVLRLLAARALPMFQGTRCLGYNETAAGPRWVTLDGVLAPGAPADDGLHLTYVRSGASLDERMRFPFDVSQAEEQELAGRVLPGLLQLNAPEVILPIIGWFFATPLKPRIQAALGHFPLLFIWGTQGCGKSSLVMEIFWPLFGVEQAEPYSASETEFALIKTFSSTASVPVFIDEYKPYDIAKGRLNALHRFIRRLYTGEVEERGRADQTVASYRLSAPVCIAGESRPTESAILERIITARPEKDTLLRFPEHAQAFSGLRSCDLKRLTGGILRFLMGLDNAQTLILARRLVDDRLAGREVPLRVRDNLVVMTTGLLHFKAYGLNVGVEVPDPALEVAIEGQLADLLECGGRAVKTGLDYFIEELAVMAVDGRIQHGQHYVFASGRLCLYFPGCHSAFTEHCNRVRYAGEVPDRNALRRQLVENQRRGGYVVGINEPVTFSTGERRRAVVLDYERIKESLEVDEFPKPRLGQGEKEHF